MSATAEEVVAEVHVNDSVELVYVLLDHEGRPKSLVGYAVDAVVDNLDGSLPPLWEGTGVLQEDETSSLLLVPAMVLEDAGDYSVRITGARDIRRHTASGIIRVG